MACAVGQMFLIAAMCAVAMAIPVVHREPISLALIHLIFVIATVCVAVLRLKINVEFVMGMVKAVLGVIQTAKAGAIALPKSMTLAEYAVEREILA
jgi:hypothetical protein